METIVFVFLVDTAFRNLHEYRGGLKWSHEDGTYAYFVWNKIKNIYYSYVSCVDGEKKNFVPIPAR